MALEIGGSGQIQPDFAVTKLVTVLIFTTLRLKQPFPAATPKKTPTRLELGCVGVMALLRLVVPLLFGSFGMPDLVRQAFVRAWRLPR